MKVTSRLRRDIWVDIESSLNGNRKISAGRTQELGIYQVSDDRCQSSGEQDVCCCVKKQGYSTGKSQQGSMEASQGSPTGLTNFSVHSCRRFFRFGQHFAPAQVSARLRLLSSCSQRIHNHRMPVSLVRSVDVPRWGAHCHKDLVVHRSVHD